MKLPIAMFALVVLSSSVGACAAVRPSADASLGRQVAELRCAQCHAIGLEDASATEGAPPLRDLYRRYAIDDLRDAFLHGLEVAHPRMPVFRLSEREVDRLVAYLRSIDPCAQPSTDSAAMARCFDPL